MPQVDITRAEYFASARISQTMLKQLWANPILYEQYYVDKTRDLPPETTDMKLGTEAERYIASAGATAVSDVVVIPDDVLNSQGHRRGSKWREFAQENPDKSLLTLEEWNLKFGAMEDMLDSVLAHDCASKWLYDSGRWSTRWFWDQRYDGWILPCRAELDLWREDLNMIIDIKTARDLSERFLQRRMIDFGYDIQAAMYMRAVRDGRSAADDGLLYGWVFIRNAPPYDVVTYVADEALIALGERRLEQRCQFYERCSQTGFVPLDFGQPLTMTAPSWATNQRNER